MFWQQISGQLGSLGTLDTASALVGLILGFLLAVLGWRAWPWLRRSGRRLAAWWRARLARWRSGAEARFLQETAVYAQQFHLGHAWADLSAIFVPPLLFTPPADYAAIARHEWGPTFLPYLWPDVAASLAGPPPPTMSVGQLLRHGRRVLLIAPPGAGKTTLLAHCAYRCATAQPGGDDDFLFGSVPALLRLDALNLEAEPLTAVIAVLQQRGGLLTSGAIARLIDLKAKTGQLLLLLDGWETCAAARQTAVVAWLTHLLAAYPDIRIFMSAQPWGYGPLCALGFSRAGIQPWPRSQAEQLAERWGRAFNLGYMPKVAQFWRAGQSALETSLRLWLLCRQPEAKPARLPRRQTDLLAATLPALATAGSLSRGKPMAVLPPHLYEFWHTLAYQMVQEGRLSLPTEALQALAARLVAESDISPRSLPASLSASPLFVTLPDESVGFLNEVWRDYLAAVHLAQHGSAAEAAAHAGDPRRADMLRFYVGQRGGTDLAMALLAQKDTSPSRELLFQVASWLPEAEDSGEWRRQILILLGQISRQSTFPQVLRQRAVAALVQTGEVGVYRFVQQLLARSDPFLRQAGAAALPLLGAARALPDLTALLADPDEQVRVTAVYALFALNHPDNEQPLLATLIGADERLSWAAARGFAWQGHAGQEILQEALEDSDVGVRRAAIQGLLQVDAPWVEPLLMRVERQDKEWLVRSAATVALEEWRGRDRHNPWLPSLPAKQGWLAGLAAKGNRPLPKGEAIRPFLGQILAESEQPAARAATAVSLGMLLAQEAAPALETAVNDADPDVREAAATALYLIRRAYLAGGE